MIIRDYRETDRDQVWHLWEISGLTLPPGCRSSKSVACRTGAALFLVADTDNGVVGSATGTWDGERGWICSVAVAPPFRRAGLARNLVQELEKRLREKGASCVLTFVPRDNLFSQMLFEDCGFRPMGDHIVMGKTL